MRALAIAAGIVFWTLALTVAVLVFFPGGNEGEPVAILEIESAPPSAAPPPKPAATPDMDLPPGFSVTGPRKPQQAPTLAPPGQGTNLVPVAPATPAPGPGGSLPQGPDRHGEAASPDAQSTADASTSATQPAAQQIAAADLVAGIDETGPASLAPVPASELVETSQYGPLPKIAADGRRPADVYARPSRYAQATGGPARVAVLVSGFGVPGGADDDLIKGLPPPVSIAYGAYGHSLQEMVTKARAEGHEVLLAIPLEPDDYPNEDPGPHTLLTSLPTDENIKRLHWLMSRYAGYAGVTNHMGAKFLSTESALRPVLEELKQRGLICFIDGSEGDSTAGQVASGLGLEYAVAQVRLDAGASAAETAEALAKLEAAAKTRGAAIGVAQAAPSTVKQITEWAGSLESKGLVLVPVSAAMRAQRQI
jgi:polysaccharide deacetylase 2 family uncharacterized protein YibQ